MRQERRFNSYFLFMVILLGAFFIAIAMGMKSQEEDYTKTEFIADMEAGKVSYVEITPNSETPTGSLKIELKGDVEKKLYVTDIVEMEQRVREQGFDPVVNAVPRQGWVLTTLVPMLIVLAVGVFLFMMINAQNAAGGGNAKMMNFGKSRAKMSLGDKSINFCQVYQEACRV